MNATTVDYAQYSDKKLLAIAANNPVLRDEIFSELDTRNAVKLDLQKAELAEHAKVLLAVGIDVDNTREVAIAYIHTNATKDWYELRESDNNIMAEVRAASYAILKSRNVSCEANAMKAWLAAN
jgi:hypothetical protein